MALKIQSMKDKKLEVIKKFVKVRTTLTHQNILLNYLREIENTIEKIDEIKLDKVFENFVYDLLSESTDRNYWKERYYSV